MSPNLSRAMLTVSASSSQRSERVANRNTTPTTSAPAMPIARSDGPLLARRGGASLGEVTAGEITDARLPFLSSPAAREVQLTPDAATGAAQERRRSDMSAQEARPPSAREAKATGLR